MLLLLVFACCEICTSDECGWAFEMARAIVEGKCIGVSWMVVLSPEVLDVGPWHLGDSLACMNSKQNDIQNVRFNALPLPSVRACICLRVV